MKRFQIVLFFFITMLVVTALPEALAETSVLGGAFNLIGEVLALPLRVTASVFQGIF